MFKHYFEQVSGVDIWPLISLAVFFIFFIGMIIWIIRANKDEMKDISEMPLHDNIIEKRAIKNQAS